MKKCFTLKVKFWKVMKICSIQAMLAITLCSLAFAHNNHAQVLDKKITLTLKEVSIEEALDAIEAVTDVKFFYSLDQLNIKEKISFEAIDRSLRDLLDELLTPYQIKYKVHERKSTITLKKENDESESGDRGGDGENVGVAGSYLVETITGRVTDAVTHQPMAGVNIIIKGTTDGTTTDSDGNFSIWAEDKDILVFSFIGYTTFETQVGGRKIIDVSMKQDIKSLKVVEVNAGYWSVKEREKTGSISKITNEEIQRQPVSNPLQAMQGRMAGVYIQQSNGVPGSNIKVRIRGQNSINSGNDPLYIIDDVPFMPGELSSTSTSFNIIGSGISPLNSISPSDIESIEVLKDADATAIYGSRGANGVILITTKKGKISKNGNPRLNFNIHMGASQVTRKIDLLNSQQYLAMRKEGFTNDQIGPTENNAPDLLVWDTTRYTDWQKELIGGTAKTMNIATSISGGNSNTQYLFSGSYENQGTVFPGDLNAGKISSRFSITNSSVENRLKTSFSANYVINNSNLIYSDLTRKALTLPPNAPKLFLPDGSLNWENSTWENPLSELQRKYASKINNLVASAGISYEIAENLEIKTNMGFNDIRMSDKSLTPSTYYNPIYKVTPQDASINFNNSNVESWIIEPQISWKKNTAKGNLSILLGSTFQEQRTEKLVQYGIGFSSNELIEDIDAASNISVMEYTNNMYRYNAIFGRLNYNLNGKYILNLTTRRDGSSRFGPRNRFGNFGAVGAAWIFSEEDFFVKTIHAVSFGKIRISYGTSGNDQIGDYQYLDTYQSSGAGYLGTVGLSPVRLFNSNFAWEVNKKLEGGLELGFFHDQILINTIYYRNRSSNQLVNYSLPMTTGFTGIQANLNAVVQNCGLEIELNSSNVEKTDFSWQTSFNITFPENKLVSFPMLSTSTYANTYVVGKPLTISRKYHFLGVNPETGIHEFEDMNNDGRISSADRLKITNIAQQYYGGLTNSFVFKGLQLDFMIQFVKQTGRSYWGAISTFPGYSFNQPLELLNNRWEALGDQGKNVQRYTVGYNPFAVRAFFDRYANSDVVITDASFIRLKNLSISYDLPKKWIKSVATSFYIQGQNLFTLTDYFGLDPENNNTGSLPLLRTVVMGLQIKL